MNILVISNMYPSEKDPVFGVFVKNFFEYVEQHNLEGRTRLVAVKGRENWKLKHAWNYARFYFQIFILCLSMKWDLIYVHTITFPVLALRVASLFRSLSLAFNVHGSDLITHSRLAETLKRMSFPLLRKAKLIVVPSTEFKSILMAECLGVNEKVVLISPSGGVDTKHFMPIRRQQGGTIVLGYVSHIIPQKGWRLFLEAIDKLRQKGYDVRGVVVGNGSEEEKLRAMLMEHSYQGVVSFWGGIPQQELPEVYNQFDLFVFPTLFFESFGLVGIEAMACGVPVVASDKGGPTEYVKHETNGFLFEQGNIEDLVRQIERFIKLSQAEKEQMATKARETALNYDKKEVLDCLYKTMRELM